MFKILKKGTLIRESEQGHNNFFYPFGDPYESPTELQIQTLAWIDPSSQSLQACLTKNLDKNRVIWVAKQLCR
jgi:hypothetical protein